MARVQQITPQLFETGVFNFFKLTPGVIEKFKRKTIDSNESEIVRRNEKRKLGEEWIHGTSKVQYKTRPTGNDIY